MARASYHLMTSDLRRLREMDAKGLPHGAIVRAVDVDAKTVRRHLGRSRTQARRIEALFVACNRALAEAAR